MTTKSLDGTWMIQSSALSDAYVIVQLFLNDGNDVIRGSLSTFAVADGTTQKWNVAGNSVRTSVSLVCTPLLGGPSFTFAGQFGADGIATGTLSGAITDATAKLVPVSTDSKNALSGPYALSGAGVPADWVVLSLFLNQTSDYVTGALDITAGGVRQNFKIAGNNVQGSVTLAMWPLLSGSNATFQGTVGADGSVTGTLTSAEGSGAATLSSGSHKTKGEASLSGNWMFFPPPAGWVVQFFFFNQSEAYVNGTLSIQSDGAQQSYSIQGNNAYPSVTLQFTEVDGTGSFTFKGAFSADNSQVAGALSGDVTATVALVPAES